MVKPGVLTIRTSRDAVAITTFARIFQAVVDYDNSNGRQNVAFSRALRRLRIVSIMGGRCDTQAMARPTTGRQQGSTLQRGSSLGQRPVGRTVHFQDHFPP